MIEAIDLLVSSACNLNCSFCFLYKHKVLNNYDKILCEAWDKKTYVKNVYNSIKAFGENPFDV